MWRIVIVLVIVGLCVHTAAALDGSGTQQDPFRIDSLADFDEFAADPNYWSGFTRLETDVNLAGRTYTTAVIAPDIDAGWTFHGTVFIGVFDGNDHKIIWLTIDDGGTGNDFLGLFGYIGEDGQVDNLGLEGGSVSGGSSVGGLVGTNYGIVSNCYSTGDVSGYYNVGGLVGINDFGSISDCYSTGDINGRGSVGGLVGAHDDGNVSNCYSTGSVKGDGMVGGLVGGNGGSVSNCYSTGDVSGEEDVGGLVGFSEGTITDSYSTGSVKGGSSVGGLVGCNGLIRCRELCWSVPGYIYNSFSIGNAQGTSSVGGLVGYNQGGDIERSFWDAETSGEPNMCGYQDEEYATGCDPNCGKTTAEMKTRSTFTDAGWDFIEIWLINEGATYPVLRQEIRSDLNGDGSVDLKDFAIFADHWLEGITP